jgi:molybdenum ABC transporter molybdate-binding protein
MNRRAFLGAASPFCLVVLAALGLLVAMGAVLLNLARPPRPETESLLVYCPAGLRLPVEQVAADYEREFDLPIQLQFGGSNTLLSQAEVAKTGDLYLAADDSYLAIALQKGLVNETIPLAEMRPVLAVKKGNPKRVLALADLLRQDVKTALGNPQQAAIGKLTRQLLESGGQWERLEAHVTKTGVFKPTVAEVANDIKLGSVDAGIIWDTTVAQYPDLEIVPTKQLESGRSSVAVGVLTASQSPTAALRFARYLAARDRGLVAFAKSGFKPVDGDRWKDVPEITFFCGSVNRRAVDRVVKSFADREGVVVNTVYNGCGILTAQMRSIRDQQQSRGFPDTYMACDRYYLENVKDWFQEDVDVSDTDVVIAVPKGNPANVRGLRDLLKPGVRISVGQPQQCTIGALTRDLLAAEGIYDDVMKNVVTQTATSAMLIPTVTTGSVDATLAYATDTKAEGDKVEAIRIDSPAAKAIQPFAIARSSDHKYLGRRLFRAIADSRPDFEAAGFHFRLSDAPHPATN